MVGRISSGSVVSYQNNGNNGHGHHAHMQQQQGISGQQGNTPMTTNKIQLACLYTKHKTQKRKVWNDGRIVLHVKSGRASLHPADPPPGSADAPLDEIDLGRYGLEEVSSLRRNELECERYLITVEGPWRSRPSPSSALGRGSSLLSSSSSGMKRVLSRKFRKPGAFVPPPPEAKRRLEEEAEGTVTHCGTKRSREAPLQPGELERRFYGERQEQQFRGYNNTNADVPYWGRSIRDQHCGAPPPRATVGHQPDQSTITTFPPYRQHHHQQQEAQAYPQLYSQPQGLYNHPNHPPELSSSRPRQVSSSAFSAHNCFGGESGYGRHPNMGDYSRRKMSALPPTPALLPSSCPPPSARHPFHPHDHPLHGKQPSNVRVEHHKSKKKDEGLCEDPDEFDPEIYYGEDEDDDDDSGLAERDDEDDCRRNQIKCSESNDKDDEEKENISLQHRIADRNKRRAGGGSRGDMFKSGRISQNNRVEQTLSSLSSWNNGASNDSGKQRGDNSQHSARAGAQHLPSSSSSPSSTDRRKVLSRSELLTLFRGGGSAANVATAETNEDEESERYQRCHAAAKVNRISADVDSSNGNNKSAFLVNILRAERDIDEDGDDNQQEEEANQEFTGRYDEKESNSSALSNWLAEAGASGGADGRAGVSDSRAKAGQGGGEQEGYRQIECEHDEHDEEHQTHQGGSEHSFRFSLPSASSDTDSEEEQEEKDD